MTQNNFPLNVNGREFVHDSPEITGKQLLELIGIKHSPDYEILEKTGEHEFSPVELERPVKLNAEKAISFIIKPYPEAEMYVNDEPYPFTEIFMTPSEIMTVADLSDKDFYLKQIIGHEDITYKDDNGHIIPMHDKIKFVTCKIANTTVS